MAVPARAVLVLFVLVLVAACGSGNDASVSSQATVVGVRILTMDGGRLDWSPDGRRLAFDRLGPNGFDVYLKNIDGSGEQCLTCALSLPPGHKGNPVWHPSGDWIVFQAEMAVHPGGSDAAKPGFGLFNELWAARVDGSEAHRILELDISEAAQGTLHPSFNASGDRLAWSHMVRGSTVADPNLSSGEWQIRVAPFSLAGGTPALALPVTYVPGVPAFYETHAFTADGSGILFSGNPEPGQTMLGLDVAILDLGTGQIRRRVTDTPTEWDEHARFAPGSGRIVFGSSRGLRPSAVDPHADLWVTEENGVRRRLTFFNTPGWSLQPAQIPPGLFTADGAFSPDGRFYASFLLLDPVAQDGAVMLLEFAQPL